jgi:hypothetical protein
MTPARVATTTAALPAFLSDAVLDCGVTPVVALSLGLVSPVHLRSFDAIESPARPGAPPVSDWVNQ